LKGWNSPNVSEEPQRIKMPLKIKLTAQLIQEMLAEYFVFQFEIQKYKD
jgi:hypothetical protein